MAGPSCGIIGHCDWDSEGTFGADGLVHVTAHNAGAAAVFQDRKGSRGSGGVSGHGRLLGANVSKDVAREMLPFVGTAAAGRQACDEDGARRDAHVEDGQRQKNREKSEREYRAVVSDRPEERHGEA